MKGIEHRSYDVHDPVHGHGHNEIWIDHRTVHLPVCKPECVKCASGEHNEVKAAGGGK